MFHRIGERGKMDNNIGKLILDCDDGCTMLVVDKYLFDYDGGTICYNLSMVDSRYSNVNGLSGRIKRAWTALFGRPIYYNDIFIENELDIVKFNNDLTYLINNGGLDWQQTSE